MKVAILGFSQSTHLTKWANGLISRGIEVILISVHNNFDSELSDKVRVHSLKPYAPWGYFLAAGKLRKLLKKIEPDILNAHYATGYGLLAHLTRFKPLLLSVWGSDVYNFPTKSIFHRLLLKIILKSATAIASTSECMLKKTLDIYNHNKTFVTPFGINENIFLPNRVQKESEKNTNIVLGTVKSLSHEYGIDTLIEAFSLIIKSKKIRHSLILEITGGGPKARDYHELAEELGVSDRVVFYGKVAHEDVPKMINRLDIFVALSRIESFGVAILEASSCGLPVVVSDADGPKEVVKDGITGVIVPKNNPAAAAEALERLVLNPKLREQMGQAGRKLVLGNYTWEKSLDIMIKTMNITISLEKKRRI